MNIQNIRTTSNNIRTSRTPRTELSTPQDSVTLGTARLPSIATFTVTGAVPILGAGINYLAGSADGAGRGDARVSLLGIGGNLAGTASLAYGLIAGNSTATNAGLGMLGFSGLAAGYVCASAM